jgi:hypothetical protein
MSDHIDETKNLIQKDFEIDFSSAEQNEEAIIELIAGRVAEMMDSDIDLLLSYLYRLDVEESKIDFILNKQSTIAAHIGLAHLIWERQKQRLATKKKYKSGGVTDGWEF